MFLRGVKTLLQMKESCCTNKDTPKKKKKKKKKTLNNKEKTYEYNNDDDELVGSGKQRRRSILPERVAGRSPIGAEMRRPFRRARDAAETHRGRAGTFLRHDLRR